jgi:radical SAM superfamily enzyme YgiQ (UPF0313 family)
MKSVNVLLVSTYELGRQPFGLASPAAWLRGVGHRVSCADLSRERLDPSAILRAELVAFYLPMHTATRLALPVIDTVRQLNPEARLCAYGLYAPLNAALLRARGVTSFLGGEFERDLVRLAGGQIGLSETVASPPAIPKLEFVVPDRSDLPALSRYASLVLPDGERRVVGSTEASRGCRHLCRHCPVVPIYHGQFRVVSPGIVSADIRAQVARGAQHITFGDPDFLNGIGHALRVVETLARECPGVSYDVTIKIEHLLRHAVHLPRLRDTGCLFVISAVESVDDRVLAILEKEHTREDFVRAVALCRQTGLLLSPTFVAFTPWTTLEGYRDLLRAIDELDLVEHVASIQLAIRLLLPEGSRLLELGPVRDMVGPFDPENLVYPWVHSDLRVDALQREIADLVGRRANASRSSVFQEVWALAHRDGPTLSRSSLRQDRPRPAVPYVDEPWYCCAEPLPAGDRLV